MRIPAKRKVNPKCDEKSNKLELDRKAIYITSILFFVFFFQTKKKHKSKKISFLIFTVFIVFTSHDNSDTMRGNR